MTNDGQILGSTTAMVAAPGSSATIVLWASSGTGWPTLSPIQCSRIKRLIINVYSSHASAASGLQIDESNDGATNWRNVVSYSISATTYTKNYVSVSAPYLRVRYVNSANVLTAWEFSVLTDATERASQ